MNRIHLFIACCRDKFVVESFGNKSVRPKVKRDVMYDNDRRKKVRHLAVRSHVYRTVQQTLPCARYIGTCSQWESINIRLLRACQNAGLTTG